MQKIDAEILLQKYVQGIATDDEKALLEAWYSQTEPIESNDFTSIDKQAQLDRLRLNLIAHSNHTAVKYSAKPVRTWPRMTAAACLLLLACFGAYYLTGSPGKTQYIARKQTHDLAPGNNKAVLTLANGKQIAVGSSKTKLLAYQGNTRIDIGTNNGVMYHKDAGKPAKIIQYNTLATPRGGQYPLMLSDGTKVWLDAASSITFPVSFNGNSRNVQITGQVYFEVAHNAKKPFKVSTGGEVIEVLGTHFNVNAYPGEPALKTTLIEGSVRINTPGAQRMLKPGEQAHVSAGKISVTEDTDIDEVLAWHNGLFQFHNADIQTVMRQLSRWYDVDVSYEGKVTNRRFSGKIYRNISALKVSDILSYKEIHFRIEGKKIIVIP